MKSSATTLAEVEPVPLQVAPGVHRVSVPLPFAPNEVAAWLIEGDRGWTLVDTGIDTPIARSALRDAAERLGVTPTSLGYVLLTHAHIDHYGLAGQVRAWSGARVAMHEREEVLARRFVDRWPDDRAGAAAGFVRGGAPDAVIPALLCSSDFLHGLYEDFRPDVLLEGERGDVPGGGGWEWILTPGHSPGHVSVYHPGRRLLIAGDHVLPRITPNIGADLYADDPLTEYLHSLRRLRALPVDLVLPSHGEPFADLVSRIDDLIRHHEARNDEIIGHLATPMTTYDLTVRLFPTVPTVTLLHAFREVAAHLAFLQRIGRATSLLDGVEIWRRR